MLGESMTDECQTTGFSPTGRIPKSEKIYRVIVDNNSLITESNF